MNSNLIEKYKAMVVGIYIGSEFKKKSYENYMTVIPVWIIKLLDVCYVITI